MTPSLFGTDLAPDTLAAVAARFGTPLYVYEADVITRQYRRLTDAFAGVTTCRFHYAAKALTTLPILAHLRSLGAGLDCVSLEEVRMGIQAGFEPADILYTPNGVSLQEIEQVMALGAGINIDNLSILEQFGTRHPEHPVCVRINPHIMAGGNQNISVGHIDSKFGISVHQMPHLLKILRNTGLKANGIHMHTGSDVLNIDAFMQATEILFEAARSLPDLDFIDFGSGFKVPYKPGDIETDVEELGERLGSRFNAYCAETGRDLALVFEPGKFLVSQSGHFLARVNVVKHTPSNIFAQVDSGFNHLIRPMLYGSEHTIENISNPGGKERFYSVVGYICETDTFATNRRIAEIREGDILRIANAGAYGFTMASNYNARLRPAEVMIADGEARLIRRRETFEDLLVTQAGLSESMGLPAR
jgi:diaminopimelate decarboxylase